MKILHVYHSLTIGGIETFLCALMNEQSRFHSVSFCTWLDGEENDTRLSPSIQRLSLHNPSLSKKYKYADEVRLFFLIWKGKYDIVHIHGAFDYYLLSAFLLHHRTRFVYTIHSEVEIENRRINRLGMSLKRFFFSRRWLVPVVLSRRFLPDFEKLYGCQAFVVENGLVKPQIQEQTPLLGKLSRGPKTRLFIHAGRICEAKNQLVLVKVFERLIREGEDVMLLIVGPVSDEELFATIRPYFSDRIVYAGPSNDVPSLLAHADAMCLPSLYEGFPISVLEALSVGCISICTPVGGVEDMITDNETGFIAKAVTEEDYEQALRRYLRCDDAKLAEMNDSCHRSFKRFQISETSSRYEELYRTSNLDS